MRPITLSDETRRFSAPDGWDEKVDGPCDELSIYDMNVDGKNIMLSGWIPDERELKRLQQGAVIFLHIHGTVHPVVGLSIQDLPNDRTNQ